MCRERASNRASMLFPSFGPPPKNATLSAAALSRAWEYRKAPSSSNSAAANRPRSGVTHLSAPYPNRV